MTRDIFDTPFGTLDIIVSAVLGSLGINRVPLSTYVGEFMGPDHIAAANAARFIGHFGDRRIQAIKAVREVTGLGLTASKHAVDQVYETYSDVNADYIAKLAYDRLLMDDAAGARVLLGTLVNHM